MILLPATPLDKPSRSKLAEWQAEVDGKPSYPEQVAAAKALFSQRNKKSNATFKEVKAGLTSMCAGARRCVYCEDSVADEVEHIAPKDLYPGAVFSWDNYVYACGPCNGPKNNKYAVINKKHALLDVTRKRNDKVVKPKDGDQALINPRKDNPVLFYDLDLLGTFILLPREGLSLRDMARANYTLDVLDLNRDVLLAARRNHFGSYRARIVEYRVMRDAGAPAQPLQSLVDGLKAMSHPTVFAEMQRSFVRDPELAALFSQVPEALTW